MSLEDESLTNKLLKLSNFFLTLAHRTLLSSAIHYRNQVSKKFTDAVVEIIEVNIRLAGLVLGWVIMHLHAD